MFRKENPGQFARKALVTAAATACLLLAAAMLVACGGQQASSGASESVTDASAAASASQAGALDTSAWATLGDVFELGDLPHSAGWDDSHYVIVVEDEGSYYRIVAKLDDETNKKMEAVDWSKDDVDAQNREALTDAVIESAEDITADAIAQDELDAFVGKTGADLEDAGFTFQDYFMYGGDQTGADYAKGYFAYMVTFDATVDENSTDDEGAALKDATIAEITLQGASNDATDPSLV